MAEMKKGQLRELSALLFFSLASFIVLATNSTLNASQLDGLNSTLDDLTDLSTLPTVNLTGKIDVFARVSFDLKTNATGLLIGLRMDNGTAIRDWVELSLEWNFNHSAENMSGLYQTPAYFVKDGIKRSGHPLLFSPEFKDIVLSYSVDSQLNEVIKDNNESRKFIEVNDESILHNLNTKKDFNEKKGGDRLLVQADS